MDEKKRRREPRKEEEARVIIETLPDSPSAVSRTFYALTRDISLNGARIRTDERFPVGTRLRITLTLSRFKQVIRLEAQVRWIKALFDGELFDMGVEFEHKIHGDIMALIRHMYGMEGDGPLPPEKK